MDMPRGVTTELYFEAHITLDPVLDEARMKLLKEIAASYDFRIADLIMVKGEPNQKDAFCSARDNDLENMKLRIMHCVRMLKKAGFVVRRYKLENTLIDSRQAVCGDILEIL